MLQTKQSTLSGTAHLQHASSKRPNSLGTEHCTSDPAAKFNWFPPVNIHRFPFIHIIRMLSCIHAATRPNEAGPKAYSSMLHPHQTKLTPSFSLAPRTHSTTQILTHKHTVGCIHSGMLHTTHPHTQSPSIHSQSCPSFHPASVRPRHERAPYQKRALTLSYHLHLRKTSTSLSPDHCTSVTVAKFH